MNKKHLFFVLFVLTVNYYIRTDHVPVGSPSVEKHRHTGIEFRYIKESEVPFFIEDAIFQEIDAQVNFVINPTEGQKERREQLKDQYKAPTGLSFLLYGAPGTGKTEMAKYIACKYGYLFTMIKQHDFVTPWSGESEINLARMMKQIDYISEDQPIVVLFDEIDSYIYSREGQHLGQHKVDLVNAFLQHLETLNRNPNVILFGTTNRYRSLDQAAVRPGRFNYHYQVNYPAKQLIATYLHEKLPLQVFNDHGSKKKIIETIIERKDFSYAYLGLLVNQTLEAYIKTGRKMSSNDFFQENPRFSWKGRMKEIKEKFLYFFKRNIPALM